MRVLAGWAMVAAAATLGGCQDKRPETVQITDPSIRLGATANAPAVLYFTVRGGSQPTRLVSAITQMNLRSELHESMTMNNMATMKPLNGVDIPAGGTVTFEQGGKHVMLYGMSSRVQPPQLVATEFTFADGTRLQAMVPTRAAGS